MKQMFKGLSFIFLCWIIILSTSCAKDKAKKLLDLKIPLFPGIETSLISIQERGNDYEVNYFLNMAFPAKSVIEFYSLEFIRNGFDKSVPRAYPIKEKIAEWQLGYLRQEDVLAKRPFHAQIDTFWIDKKEGRCVWLMLFYDWRTSGGSVSDIKKNDVLNVSIRWTQLNERVHNDNLDIYNYFKQKAMNQADPSKFRSGDEGEKNISGEYLSHNETFVFAEITDIPFDSSKNMDFTETEDLDKNKKWIANVSEFNQLDFEKVKVEILGTINTSREDESPQTYQLIFVLKHDSIARVSQSLSRDNRYLGIIKDKKVVSFFYLKGWGIENENELIVRGLGKKRVRYFIRGFVRNK